MSGIVVREAREEREVAAALALRRAVFVAEQGVPLADELDGRDDRAVHLVALDEDIVVGTCRLLPGGPTLRLSRMAVASSHRGRGIAGALLAETDRHAARAGVERIVLTAQLPAVRVYERAGYRPRGEVFDEVGILHLRMEKLRA